MNDLRGIVTDALRGCGMDDLSIIGLVSDATSAEQQQLKAQKGPKKRTFVQASLDSAGGFLTLATTYVREIVHAQHLSVLLSDGQTASYHYSPASGQGYLYVGGGRLRTDPLNAVAEMLKEAYGKLNQ